MANLTDDSVRHIHGMNPQNLVEKIVRNRIYSCMYWKEECFGLTAESLVDKAIDLEYIGGTFGGNQQPTPFICLVLKMLQIQPEMDIVMEFIQNEEYKYVTALGCVYLRLVGTPLEIYTTLEPFYNDYRKLRKRNTSNWEITFMDVVVDTLLNEDFFIEIALPRLPDRIVLEQTNKLAVRKSILEEDK